LRLQGRSFWQTLVRIFGYVFSYKRLLVPACFLIVLGTLATLTEPWLFGHAIDAAIVPHDWTRLKWIAAAFFGVECIRVSSMIGHGYLFEWLGQKVMQELRMELFTQLQVLPVSTYDRTPVGRLVTRVTNDIAALSEMFSAGFVAMIGNVLVVVGIFVWMLALDRKLGIIAGAVFPFLVIAAAFFSKKLQVAYRNARTRLSALNAFLAENILGIRVVHLFGREKLHHERFGEINEQYAQAQISSIRVFAFFQPTITWASGISVALVIWFGGGMALAGSLKVGVLVTFFAYSLQLFQPVREIADKWNIILSGMAAAERVFSILSWSAELEPEAAGAPAPEIPPLRGEIVFENVWFAYNTTPDGSHHWVLRDFSLRIEPGMQVGIVGHTGAGKTTLISLLMRFYEPQKGRILIDGRDIREYDKRALRAAIGIIQQDVFLFSGSISENISLWREPKASAGEQVTSFLNGMGYSDWMGEDSLELQERGSNLSMGERQVMAFSRAMASDPSIWILDEATANIDSRSEQELERALKSASSGRTSILIAHRLSTVQAADKILVLHKGALVEEGNHRELLAHDGVYARLYRYQDSLRGE
jgi:ATP-binding cassette subfamily B protein